MPKGKKKPPPGTPSEREAALAAATLATPDGVEPKKIEVSAYVVYDRIKSGDWYGQGDYVKNRPFAPLKEAKVKCDLSTTCEELVRQLLEGKNIFTRASRKGVTSRRVTDLLDSPVANMAPLTPAAGEL